MITNSFLDDDLPFCPVGYLHTFKMN